MCILVLKYGRCYFDRDFLHIATRKFIRLHDKYWDFYSLHGFIRFFVSSNGRVDFRNTEVSVYKKRVIVLRILHTIFSIKFEKFIQELIE